MVIIKSIDRLSSHNISVINLITIIILISVLIIIELVNLYFGKTAFPKPDLRLFINRVIYIVIVPFLFVFIYVFIYKFLYAAY